jgi:hypothetical protein
VIKKYIIKNKKIFDKINDQKKSEKFLIKKAKIKKKYIRKKIIYLTKNFIKIIFSLKKKK